MAASRTFARYGTRRFGEHGLSPARVRLIDTLRHSPGIRMNELAKRLDISGRAVTALVDALEADGVVSRMPDQADRRAFRLELTKAGTGLLATIDELQATVSEEAFKSLDPAERASLAALLCRLGSLDA